jgi:hypothetical protein
MAGAERDPETMVLRLDAFIAADVYRRRRGPRALGARAEALR